MDFILHLPLIKFLAIKTPRLQIRVSVPELDYSYSLYLGMAAMQAMPLIFILTMSLSVLFGDLFKTTWGLDTRINLEVKIPVFYDIINLSIIPYVSFVSTFSEIGYVDGGDYFQFSSVYIRSGSKIHS